MPGTLAGVRIIDMTTVLAGPFSGQMLGDQGADVIKVEPPQGDVSRWIGASRSPGMGARFLQLNRNKRSAVVDLKTAPGLAAITRLCETADVLIYNIRPDAMEAFGLGYERLSKLNPRLVVCGITGFGQGGPYAGKPAYDDVIQAATAIPSLLHQVNGAPPGYVPSAIADLVAGVTAAFSICAALYARERTGLGDAIEVPMFETMAHFVLTEHIYGHSFTPPMGELGYPRLLAKERRPFPTQDGHICVIAYTDLHCRKLFSILGRPDLAEDPRFANVDDRARNANDLNKLLSDLFSSRSTAQWVAELQGADIPAMPLADLPGLMADPHLAATGFFQHTEHPSEGPIIGLRSPVGWTRSQHQQTRPAPRLGEHTREVMDEIGDKP